MENSNLMNQLIQILPLSPFRSVIAEFSSLPYLGYINWFIPVGDMLRITALWLAAITIYYLYMVAMRWLRVIS